MKRPKDGGHSAATCQKQDEEPNPPDYCFAPAGALRAKIYQYDFGGITCPHCSCAAHG